jgi:hypothetical protein
MDLWRGSVDPDGMRPNPPHTQQVPSATSAHQSAAPVMPRVLSFYRDVLDNDGTVTGYRTIAWGLPLADGSVLSTSVRPPASVTIWPCRQDAATALDAFVDTPDPRRPDRNLLPSRAATIVPPSNEVDSAAALVACPHDPVAGEGQDRPLGTARPHAGGVPGGGQ